MLETDLLVRRGRDAHTELGDVACLVGDDLETRLRGVDDDEAVASVRRVDHERADSLDLEGHTEIRREGRYVRDRDALRLAASALRAYTDDPSGRFHDELGLGLDQRNDSRVEDNRRDADRVRPRHRRSVGRFHDDPRDLRSRIFRRHEKVHVPKDPASRLVENKTTQAVILLDEAPLLPDRLAGRRSHPTDDDVSHFTFSVAGDDMNHLGCSHRDRPSSIRELETRKSQRREV